MEASYLKLHGTATILPSGRLAIGGTEAAELAARFGTPLWVIDEDHFRANCRTFRQAFRTALFPEGVEVVYSAKALAPLALCRIVHEEGLSLDVVSGGELHAALTAGFPAGKTYFHGNNKTATEILLALEAGVGRFMVDSLDELRLLEATAAGLGAARSGSGASRSQVGGRRADVILRLTPDVDVAAHDYVRTGVLDSKFGVAIETGQAREAVELALASPHVALRGIHCHIGSQIFDAAPFERAATVLLDFAAEVRDATGFVPGDVSLGGGFGIRYVEGDTPLAPAAFAAAIARTIREKTATAGLPMPRVLVEPGRSICATAGWTLYTVGSVKDIPGVRTFVSVDGGMSDNPRPALYGARYEACLANRAAEEPGAEVFTIAGRCCESGGLLVRDLPLPRPVVGDILAVSCTGAYNYSMAMNYNHLPRPAMVLVRDGLADVIIERETYVDLVRRERIPPRLLGPLPPASS